MHAQLTTVVCWEKVAGKSKGMPRTELQAHAGEAHVIAVCLAPNKNPNTSVAWAALESRGLPLLPRFVLDHDGRCVANLSLFL